MPIFHAIAAMSENRVIGDHGKIPWHLPEDFRWFKHKTMGGTLIMGRKTFESIGKPLPGRETWVLCRHPNAQAGIKTFRDLFSLIDECEKMPENKVFWICGGAQIYQQLLPNCQFLYLTQVKRKIKGDAFFPEFENRFSLDQVIHENSEFRVERWRLKELHQEFQVPQESWPFPTEK